MFEILYTEALNSSVSRMTLLAPNISKNVLPGQFIILRVDEFGERIPLTVFDYSRKNGTIDIIYQKIGTTTLKLDEKNEGDSVLDVVGPLGKATDISNYKKAVVVSGGVGGAISYPLAKALKNQGAYTAIISGFRNKDMVILENEMKHISDYFEIMTDDGSNGNKGFVTDALFKLLEKDSNYDVVITIGPLPMMKAVCDITKRFNIKTIVSMNSIMIDGTGMCGGCRVTVEGKVKFACIDGPDFDGHKVDFEESMQRGKTFAEEERFSREKYCNLYKGAKL